MWYVAEVADAAQETARARTLTLSVPDWPGHRAGQHIDVRLTAEDGYQAVRSYSIASPPGDRRLSITVERLDDGEMSPYLVDEARPGDRMELRGPIGGYFVWEPGTGGPLLLVGGGSGIVPLMSMLRHKVAAASAAATHLLYSSRSPEEVIYGDELERLAKEGEALSVVHTFTRSAPPEWDGYRRRIDRAMLAEVAWSPPERPLVFVCGPTGLVEAVASELVALGHMPQRIKTERFGPTGR